MKNVMNINKICKIRGRIKKKAKGSYKKVEFVEFKRTSYV